MTGSIVVYNQSYEILEAAVNSFLGTDLPVLLFIIDNSPADTLKTIAAKDPSRIRYIFNNANLGYGTAHNIALRLAIGLGSRYHMVFNADTYFSAGTLECMRDFMDHHPDIGHLMPKVLYPDGRLQRLCRTAPSIPSLAARRFLPFFIHDWFRKGFDKTEYGQESYEEILYDIPFLSGCCMFFRTRCLEEVGLFDERFFMYLEDADMTRRMLSRYRNVYYPEAVIYHYYEKGSYKSFRLTIYHIKSALSYFRKWGW